MPKLTFKDFMDFSLQEFLCPNCLSTDLPSYNETMKEYTCSNCSFMFSESQKNLYFTSKYPNIAKAGAKAFAEKLTQGKKPTEH